jgi:hypothetical protein
VNDHETDSARSPAGGGDHQARCAEAFGTSGPVVALASLAVAEWLLPNGATSRITRLYAVL